MDLTPEQLWYFRHNGFLKLAYQLPQSTVAKLKEAVYKDIAAEKGPVTRDADGIVQRLSDILGRDPIFWKTATCPPLLDALKALLGPNIEVIRNRHNHVMLRSATLGSYYMHRDAFSFTRSSVTAMIYLEETNLENGCTEILPGTHLLPWLEQPLEENEKFLQMDLRQQAVRLPMPAGGIVLLDSSVCHSQGANHTDGTRMSITLGYHSADELAGGEDDKSTLVCGSRIYKGNDRKRKS